MPKSRIQETLEDPISERNISDFSFDHFSETITGMNFEKLRPYSISNIVIINAEKAHFVLLWNKFVLSENNEWRASSRSWSSACPSWRPICSATSPCPFSTASFSTWVNPNTSRKINYACKFSGISALGGIQLYDRLLLLLMPMKWVTFYFYLKFWE